MQQSRLLLPSPLALPCLIALACLCSFVWVALLQGAFSQTEKHMNGEKVRHKIATKTKPAEKGERVLSFVARRAVAGAPCLREMGRMA